MEELYGPLIASNDMPGSGAGFVISRDRDGKKYIHAIRCKVNGPYENDVRKDCIYYCRHPTIDHEELVQAARDKDQGILAYVMKGTKSYKYGLVKFAPKEENDTDSNGNLRYKLNHVHDDEQTAELSSTLAKRSRLSIWCTYKEIHFRSLLEARHAKFMDLLGIKWEYERIQFHLDNDGTYTIDFYISHPFVAYVEIKPDDPQDDALWKCEQVCKITGQNVYLFYRDKFRVAYVEEGRDYSHSNGIRALHWHRNSDNSVIMDESKHVWTMDDNMNCTIDKRRGLGDCRFKHQSLLDMYASFDDEGIHKG